MKVKQNTNFLYFFLIIVVLFNCTNTNKNSVESFTEQSFINHIIEFNPTLKKGTSNKEFKLGKVRFEEALRHIKKNKFNITSDDYWNLTMAQINLKEPVENIRYTFYKAYELDPNMICFLMQFQKDEMHEGYLRLIHIVPEFDIITNTCQTTDYIAKDDVCPIRYSEDNSLNIELVTLFQRIELNDQKYRMGQDSYIKNKQHQDILDENNLENS